MAFSRATKGFEQPIHIFSSTSKDFDVLNLRTTPSVLITDFWLAAAFIQYMTACINNGSQTTSLYNSFAASGTHTHTYTQTHKVTCDMNPFTVYWHSVCFCCRLHSLCFEFLLNRRMSLKDLQCNKALGINAAPLQWPTYLAVQLHCRRLLAPNCPAWQRHRSRTAIAVWVELWKQRIFAVILCV